MPNRTKSETHNSDGVEYAKLADLKEGDRVNVDSGFTCRRPGWATVRKITRKGTPYIACRRGKHFLDGRCDDGIHCIGITPRG